MEKIIGANEVLFGDRKYVVDSEGFIDFGELSRAYFKRQSQYVSRDLEDFVTENAETDSPVRIKGNFDMYHGLRLHKDDIERFIDYMEERER